MLIWVALGDDPETWAVGGSVGKLAVGLLLLSPPQAVANRTAETTSNILCAITIDDRNPLLIFLLYRNTCELRPTVSLVFLCLRKIKESVASPWSVGLISLPQYYSTRALEKGCLEVCR